MSSAYEHSDERAFQIPQSYHAMRARGLFDPEGKNELFLTDFQWLSLLTIASSTLVGGAIPFARTTRREHFCWAPEHDHGRGVPVTFHPRGESPALYSPDFTAFIFRALLEEFSLSWLVNGFGLENTAARFRRYADAVTPFLPDDWARTVREVSRRPLVRLGSGVYGVLSREESDYLIQEALATPGLNQPLEELAGIEA